MSDTPLRTLDAFYDMFEEILRTQIILQDTFLTLLVS